MGRGGLTRVGLACPALFLIAGTLVLLFLMILAGSYDRSPLNKIFYLQADTKGIPNAPQGICHWTPYNFCDSKNDVNTNCRPNRAAYPFEPQENFHTTKNIPGDFLKNHKTYFYLSRFLYAFYLISIFFTTCALLTGLAAICAGIGGLLAALCSGLALFCVTFCATIMTACFVLAQKAFRHDGRFARVGVKAFAFTWTTVPLLFLATIGFFLSWLAHRRNARRSRYGDSPNTGGKRAGGFGMGRRTFRNRSKTPGMDGADASGVTDGAYNKEAGYGGGGNNRNSTYTDDADADSQQRINRSFGRKSRAPGNMDNEKMNNNYGRNSMYSDGEGLEKEQGVGNKGYTLNGHG